MNINDRFWKKVHRTEQCWEWTASRDRDGYGIFWIQPSKSVKSHRFSAALAGKNIDDKVVRHTCHNPACVNPDHLVTGTQQENLQDMFVAGRANMGHGGRKKIPVRTPLGDFHSIGAAAKANGIDATTVRKRILKQSLGWTVLQG